VCATGGFKQGQELFTAKKQDPKQAELSGMRDGVVKAVQSLALVESAALAQRGRLN
jgi:hypothetical protein